jgi:predicted DNA-binding transcriptional regulator AlpA
VAKKAEVIPLAVAKAEQDKRKKKKEKKKRKCADIAIVGNNDGQDPPEQLLRIHEVRTLTGLGRSTIYRLEAAGRFPLHLKLTEGGHSSPSAWRASEVHAWVKERCEGKAA